MNDENKKMISLVKKDGSVIEVEVMTYLFSDDNQSTYIVYSKGEKIGADEDLVVYVNKIVEEDGVLYADGIKTDEEWLNVQTLFKRIANK